MIDTKKKAFLIALLRRGTYKWRPRNETLAAARVERGKYRCAKCNDIVGRKEIQVDHIDPVIDPIKGWISFDDFIERLFCGKEGLQALCKTKCHSEKSKAENELRRETKKRVKKLLPDSNG